MLNVPTLPPGLSVSRHFTWIASPVTLPTGVAVWRRQRASIKQREDVVERHFNGEFGLTESLKRRGIMDADGNILDKRRLINSDEMSAFLDFITHDKKAIGQKGTALQTSSKENRECATVNMAGDSGGFIYGPQYLAARKHFQAAFGDCTVPWGGPRRLR